MKQKSLLGALALLAALFLTHWLDGGQPSPADEATRAPVELSPAQSGKMLTIEAEVIKLLRDDNNGSRHQRFLVRTSSGQRVLVAHNIDLAQRIDDVAPGDPIRIRGQFEWNEKGGVLHWTHDDPRGDHDPGWIEHLQRRYQ